MRTARVVIDYTNYKGERSERLITPQGIRFGSNRWHPDEQWLLQAVDSFKDAERTFALTDIHSWRAASEDDEKALTAPAPHQPSMTDHRKGPRDE
jgi:predicted DNA-binding transcriptional regulator YafY